MTNIFPDCMLPDGAEPCKGYQRLQSDNVRLRAVLGKLRWKSIDRDNMEFRCDITCFVMDELRAALEPKP